MKKCPSCKNEDIPSESRFCPRCGFDFSKKYYCKYCGKQIHYGDSFCDACGLEQSPKIPIDSDVIDSAVWKVLSKSTNGCKEYVKRYPNGRHLQEANKVIQENTITAEKVFWRIGVILHALFG